MNRREFAAAVVGGVAMAQSLGPQPANAKWPCSPREFLARFIAASPRGPGGVIHVSDELWEAYGPTLFSTGRPWSPSEPRFDLRYRSHVVRPVGSAPYGNWYAWWGQ